MTYDSLQDVETFFQTNPFVMNPLITIIVSGRFDAPQILAVLIKFNKNDAKRGYTSRGSYLNYLRS